MTSETASQLFEWRKPALFGSAYELRDGQDVLVAELHFEDKPAVSWGLTDPRAARASAGGHQWRLTTSRPGLGGALGFSAHVSVTGDTTLELDLTSFLSQGMLRVPDNRQLVWQGKVVRGTASAFTTADEAPLVLFRSGSPTEKVVSHVEVTAGGLGLVEWRFLAVLGLYLRLLTGRAWR